MRRAAVLLLLLSSAALADPARDAVKGAVNRCDAFADNHAWLDCFYGAAQPMRATLGLAPAPQAAMVPVPGAPPRPPSSAPAMTSLAPPPPRPGANAGIFGDNVRLVDGLRVAGIRYAKDGSFIFTLEDGEAWAQNSPPPFRSHFDEAPSHYVVDVTEELLSSDILRIRGEKRTFKVHRIV